MPHRFSQEKAQTYMDIAKMSISEVCTEAGLHIDTVQRWLKGRSPSTRCLDMFRSVLAEKTKLDICLDDLLE